MNEKVKKEVESSFIKFKFKCRTCEWNERGTLNCSGCKIIEGNDGMKMSKWVSHPMFIELEKLYNLLK